MSDEAILAGTVRAISKHGPARLTLAHVASEVGISPGAIVQRFGSKRDLLLAVGAMSGGELEAEVDAALARRSPLDALHHVLAAQVRELRSPEALANHVAFLQLDLADPDLRDRARRHAHATLAAVRRLASAAVDAGELRPVDPGAIAEVLYVTYNGALITWGFVGKGSLRRWLRAQLDAALSPYVVEGPSRS